MDHELNGGILVPFEYGLVGEQLGEPGLTGQTQLTVKSAASQVAIDEQDPGAGERQGQSQIDRDG